MQFFYFLPLACFKWNFADHVAIALFVDDQDFNLFARGLQLWFE